MFGCLNVCSRTLDLLLDAESYIMCTKWPNFRGVAGWDQLEKKSQATKVE